MKRLLLFWIVAVSVNIYAQYPQISEEAMRQAASSALIDRLQRDSVWAEAFKIVVKEAKEGRPYVPWASKPYDLRQAKIPAFPGAEGGGMFTFGGRGGKVLTVTTLDDSGPGSFRWACEQGGARIIVFNVSGIIWLKSPVSVRAPYITIAGQTAPGEGITIAGETFNINTHDVIVRHMRFRRGKTSALSRDDAFGGNPVGNIMIDHCSCEWGLDENISFYRHMFNSNDGKEAKKLPTVNVTIQNTISAKALDNFNHAFGSTIGGENTTFMRNLWASNTGRNPSIGMGGVFNFVNNVVFNWLNRTADGGDYTMMCNFINNYYKPGPVTPKDDPVRYRIVCPEGRSGKLFPWRQFGRVYATGNIVEGNEAVTRDNWNGGIQLIDKDRYVGTPEDMAMMRSDEPFEMAPLKIMESEKVFEWVLQHVGATIPCRDVVDERIINEVRTGIPYYVKDYEQKVKDHPYGDMSGLHQDSQNEEGHFRHRHLPKDSYKMGIITDPRQMGGYPVYKSWKPWKDSDGDGMPDEWEKQNGLNPNDPADANGDLNGDGYTNIEKYINAIPTKGKVDWRNLNNNYDTLAEKGKVM